MSTRPPGPPAVSRSGAGEQRPFPPPWGEGSGEEGIPLAGPALAICGFSGAGKTTLLEATVRKLAARGLCVACVKETEKAVEIDRPGKDSDRLFQAGAAVALGAAGEHVTRRHASLETERLATVHALTQEHDLVFVEGGKRLPLPKVWLGRQGEPDPPPDVAGIVANLPWGAPREERLLQLLDDWLPRAWRARPVFGGVLIGGASSRMGRPKHLITWGGKTLLEIGVDALRGAVDRVVLIGAGDVPPQLAALDRLPDTPGLAGPLAGLLAAMRWAPGATWIIAACDMPLITSEAVAWLRSGRAPGTWALLPRLSPRGVEPLLALYEPPIRRTIERLVLEGERAAPRWLDGLAGVSCPPPPVDLRRAWTNVNDEAELRALGR